MSHIEIHARHGLSRKDAQAAADELASDLAGKFGIDFAWEGDHIHFERSGVNGTITVREKEILVDAQLGFVLTFLKPKIEHEITRYLEDHFGCTFA